MTVLYSTTARVHYPTPPHACSPPQHLPHRHFPTPTTPFPSTSSTSAAFRHHLPTASHLPSTALPTPYAYRKPCVYLVDFTPCPHILHHSTHTHDTHARVHLHTAHHTPTLPLMTRRNNGASTTFTIFAGVSFCTFACVSGAAPVMTDHVQTGGIWLEECWKISLWPAQAFPVTAPVSA